MTVMLGKIANILTAAQNALVQSAKNTQAAIDKAQSRLASGKAVNSALDGPSSFFTARALSQTAGDLSKLLDGITLNIQTIKGAAAGADAITKLIDQAEALLDEAAVELYSGTYTSLITSLSASDIAAILAANPGVSYSAATHSFYRVGAPATWAAANAAAQAATLIEPAGVSGVSGVTGHLANITSATENAYVDGLVAGNAWLGGSDAGVEGTWRWVAGPEAGDQFWQGGSGGSTVGASYANWGAGEPNNSGNEDYVHMRADGRWNDQASGTSYQYVMEWDESLFVSQVDPKLVERAAEYTKQYLKIMDQITMLAKDTQFRGIQLLKGENMRTDFNVKRTSFLETEGMDATAAGLGLVTSNFLQLDFLNLAKEQVRAAKNDVRSYASTLAMDLNIMSIRLDFTKSTIGVHEEGASALVDADKNEVGAELLALNVKQQLQTMALRLASQSFIQRLF
jgi:flagellin-like hook-associated protein FlgL